MSVYVLLEILRAQISFLSVCLPFEYFFILWCLTPAWIQCLLKVTHLSSCSFDILLYLVPNLLILEIRVPDAALWGWEWMVYHGLVLFLFLLEFCIFDVWLNNQFLLESFILLEVSVQLLLPFRCIKGKWSKNNAPNDWSERFDIIRDSTKSQLGKLTHDNFLLIHALNNFHCLVSQLYFLCFKLVNFSFEVFTATKKLQNLVLKLSWELFLFL